MVANCACYKTKLINLKCGSRSVSEYLQEDKPLSDALAAIDEPVPNKDLAQIVLCGLDSEYDMLVIFIEMQSELPKFSVLWAHLLRFKAKASPSSQESQSFTSPALMASQSSEPLAPPPSYVPRG